MQMNYFGRGNQFVIKSHCIIVLLFVCIYIYIYIPGFFKRWLLKICPFSPETHRNWVFFYSHEPRNNTGEKREERGEREKEKKDSWHS